MQRAVIRWNVERRREVGIRITVVVCDDAFLRRRQPRRPCSLEIVHRTTSGLISQPNTPFIMDSVDYH